MPPRRQATGRPVAYAKPTFATSDTSDDDATVDDSDSASVEQPLPPPPPLRQSTASTSSSSHHHSGINNHHQQSVSIYDVIPGASAVAAATTATTSAITAPFKKRSRARLTTISRKYDLDGDGELDEAEQAMRDRDILNRGFLTNEEIYSIVQDQLKAKRSAGYMKKLIVGLICFVVLLALSNLGTSLAAAFLAKDLKADNGGAAVEGEAPPVPTMRISATDEIAAAQTVADTYEAVEMDDDELEERRLMVLEEMEDDPHSHPHRRLKKNKRVTFDSMKLDEADFFDMESKCKQQKNVYIKLKKGDSSRNECICEGGKTSVVVKERKAGGNKKKKKSNDDKKKKKDKNNKKPNKKQRGNDREVIIERGDGRTLHADCSNGVCHCGGEVLRGLRGDTCRLNADECDKNLVCEKSNNKNSKNLRNGQFLSSKYGTCQKPTTTNIVIVRTNDGPQRGRSGDFCETNDRNYCQDGLWCEPSDFDDIVRNARNGGGGGGTGNGGYGVGCQGVVIAGPSGTIDTRTEGCFTNNNNLPSNARGRSNAGGVGTCQRTAGYGQTCWDDWQCNDVNCDGLGGGSQNGSQGGSGSVITGASGTIVTTGWSNGGGHSAGICN